MSDITATVRDRYAEAARRAIAGNAATCGCGTTSTSGCDPITSHLYDASDAAGLPAAALRASLGCGNPVALAALQPGDVVLDLGSGGGIDVLLSAQRVGHSGKAYGLDMTDEMLELARANATGAGVTNVEFMKGHIEAIPLPDASVDVIISNCVINLAADKSQVLREAFRVLKPGGRFAVSDVILRSKPTPELRQRMDLWAGCVAGALTEEDYLALLKRAGFEQVQLELTREYEIDGVTAASAFVRATKPQQRGCCGPTCCS